MTAVLRVKRKKTDTPLDKLVIACKRAKTESSLLDESESPIHTIVQFATTLTDPIEDVAQHVAKVIPKISTEIVKVGTKRTYGQAESNCYTPNISNKKWIGVESLGERYKVVNCQRSQDTLKTEEDSEEKWMTLIDVEDSWSVSNITAKQNAEETKGIEDFVFDLYCGPTNDDVWLENNEILIQEPEYPVFDYGGDESDSTDDSNAESHWLNDYPDTDYSRDEDYDSDYSNNDDYVYVDPDEEKDIEMYGYSYAKYRRMIQSVNLHNSSSSSNSSDDEGRSSNYSSDDESMGIL